jgi:type IV pilus assembly protein PilV
MQLNLHSAGRVVRRRTRGFGLIDAMIALAILSFGLLAMTGMQSRMVAGATEAQSRLVAQEYSDELIATVLVDTANAACYTKPAAGTCGSATATARTTDWAARAASAPLLNGVTTGAVLNAGTGRFTVTINWTGKESGTTRTLEAATDVR